MSFREVMALPIKTFWFMAFTINRIRAEVDLRGLMVGVASQGGELLVKRHQRLVLESQGLPLDEKPRVSEERDHAAFEQLRLMAKKTT